MNLKKLHTEDEPSQAARIFSFTDKVTIINIKGGNQLEEHESKMSTLLSCLTGEVIFENEEGNKERLLSINYLNIESGAKHWEMVNLDSNRLLIKK